MMDSEEEKKVVVPKRTSDILRYKVEKLMKNPDKPVFIPEKKEEKLPRVFNPPEFIRNIWGSSAGVGSGDFHIYRNMRRRQNARLKFMDFKTEQERLDVEFQDKLEENWIKAGESTAKKRAKRLKKKQKQKAKKQKTAKAETESESESDEEEEDEEEELKKCIQNKRETSTQDQPTTSNKRKNKVDNEPETSTTDESTTSKKVKHTGENESETGSNLNEHKCETKTKTKSYGNITETVAVKSGANSSDKSGNSSSDGDDNA